MVQTPPTWRGGDPALLAPERRLIQTRAPGLRPHSVAVTRWVRRLVRCPASLASGAWASRPKLAAGSPGWTTAAWLQPPVRKSVSGESVQKGSGRPALSARGHQRCHGFQCQKTGAEDIRHEGGPSGGQGCSVADQGRDVGRSQVEGEPVGDPGRWCASVKTCVQKGLGPGAGQVGVDAPSVTGGACGAQDGLLLRERLLVVDLHRLTAPRTPDTRVSTTSRGSLRSRRPTAPARCPRSRGPAAPGAAGP